MARDGKEVNGHRHVDHGLERDGEAQSDNDEPAKEVMRATGHSDRGQHEPEVHEQNGGASHKSILLDDGGVDEIRIVLGEEVLVQTTTRTHSFDAAFGNGGHG